MEEKQKTQSELDVLKEINNNILRTQITPFRAFRNGILSGLGAVLGATVVLALLLAVLSQFSSVPIIGNLIEPIVNEVRER